jgi:hypothetical protein
MVLADAPRIGCCNVQPLRLAIDLPGHGRSEGRDASFDRYWDAIHALCDHLDIERIAKRHPLDDCMGKRSAKFRS